MNVIGGRHDTWHYQCSIKITAFPAFPRGFITYYTYCSTGASLHNGRKWGHPQCWTPLEPLHPKPVQSRYLTQCFLTKSIFCNAVRPYLMQCNVFLMKCSVFNTVPRYLTQWFLTESNFFVTQSIDFQRSASLAR